MLESLLSRGRFVARAEKREGWRPVHLFVFSASLSRAWWSRRCPAFVRPVKPKCSAAGEWLVCPDCVGRRSPPSALCDACVDNGFKASAGSRARGAAEPFRRNLCCALDAASRREAFVEAYASRRDPMLARKDISAVCLGIVEFCRATLAELRSALLSAKKH